VNITQIQNLAIAYIAVWTISPPLFASGIARVFVVLATLLLLGLELARPDSQLRRLSLPVMLALGYIAYTGCIELMLTDAEGLLRHIQIWIMLFFLVVWQIRRHDLQSLVPVFWIVLTVYPIWQFITVCTIDNVNSHAARVLVRNSAEGTELTQQGVGGYALVYGTLLLIPSLIGLALNPRVLRGNALPKPLRMMPKLALGLVWLNIGLGILLVLKAGFSLAVIALAAILLSVTFLKSFNATRLVISMLAALSFAMLARPILETVLTELLPVAQGTNFANKIRDVLESLEAGNAVGTAEHRLERYTRSLGSFLNSPLWGTMIEDGVGNHSEILDSYARWGAGFGTIIVYLVCFPAVRAMRNHQRDFGVGLAMLAAVTVIFGLNIGFAAAGLMLYIMFPVALHILHNANQHYDPYDLSAMDF